MSFLNVIRKKMSFRFVISRISHKFWSSYFNMPFIKSQESLIQIITFMSFTIIKEIHRMNDQVSRNLVTDIHILKMAVQSLEANSR